MKKYIPAPSIGGAARPYSNAVDTGNMLFISGQIGVDPATDQLPESFELQAKNVMNNLKAVLDQAGYGFEQVVKATVFLTDMTNFAKTNEIYTAFFPNDKPARSCIQVAALPLGAKIEIELIAVK